MRLIPLLALSAALAAADPALAQPSRPAGIPDGIRLGLAIGSDAIASEGGAVYTMAMPSDLTLVAGLGGGATSMDDGDDYAAYALGFAHLGIGRMVEIGTSVRGGPSTSDDRNHFGSISADAILWLAGGARWSVGATASYAWTSEFSGASYGLVYEARPW